MKTIIFCIACLCMNLAVKAENGYRLWLRYDKVNNAALLQQYRQLITGVAYKDSNTATKELLMGLQGLLDKKITRQATGSIALHVLTTLPKEGFTIRSASGKITIAGGSDAGLLYGVFHFLRLLQTQQSIAGLNISSAPAIQLRLLNHWDNLNRTVERGYAGNSIWDWQRLPGYIDPRYIDYARANASIGINGTVLTNVNANAMILTDAWIEKVAALATVFRAYHIKVYLTARFSAPVEIGGLKTADPLDPAVQQWWKQKAAEIYKQIPDFGGFLVKANSEGQPGPQNYKRTHADGANMLADAVAPFGGIVMWRAFVYSSEQPDDRFKQAYNEFQPLDGQFRKNVIVQVKNGPIDFQPREPYHPLFGAMPKTPLMMEFQLTQEYLGFASHLVYMGTLFKEVLNEPKVVPSISGMAGVSNIGSAVNWTGHPFGQSNWYTLGRLAWQPTLTPESIAREWIKQTFSNDKAVVDTIARIMLTSHETVVNYMTPLGLHHIMGYGHHYGPAPWYDRAPRADWNPVYFHRADSTGIGFDRRGSALAQYPADVQARFGSLENCPEEYLLWFHHVPWNFTMRSGRSLWDELCYKYGTGADSARWMQRTWNTLAGRIDETRFKEVQQLLAIQATEALWWRDACLLYFQTFSRKPVPFETKHSLDYYKQLNFPYAPN